MQEVFRGLDPASYRSHPLHDAGRHWPETNCYVDLLIEVLHAAGYEPAAALGFTVAQDFEGDHFTFFKFPTADLQQLFGLDIEELAIFDRLDAHVMTQIGRGRLPLVEVDAFFLPDTRGLSYRIAHSKTTIGINALDPDRRRMVYFHGPGAFVLEGEDYDGIFASGNGAGALPLFPYTEFVKFDRTAASGDIIQTARRLLARHLARRPERNPVEAFRAVFADHAAALADRPPDYFHIYAFNTLRQLGGDFELLSSHLDWLGGHGQGDFAPASAAARSIAEGAKTMQFKLARAMARKRFDGLSAMIAPLAEAYDTVMGALDERLPDASAAEAA
jgi:hypothetical protein